MASRDCFDIRDSGEGRVTFFPAGDIDFNQKNAAFVNIQIDGNLLSVFFHREFSLSLGGESSGSIVDLVVKCLVFPGIPDVLQPDCQLNRFIVCEEIARYLCFDIIVALPANKAVSGTDMPGPVVFVGIS